MDAEECCDCGLIAVPEVRWKMKDVPVGDDCEVAVRVPIHFCTRCGAGWTGHLAEELIDDAVRSFRATAASSDPTRR